MSEPVSNVEIEDVLSSIRRLVSVDNGRAKRKPLPLSPDMATPGSTPDDKLILTEDLRIQPTPELVDGRQLKDLSEDYTKTLERRIAELEAAVTAQSHEYEPDGSEDTAQHRPTSVLFPKPPLAQSQNDGALDLDKLLNNEVLDEDPRDKAASDDPESVAIEDEDMTAAADPNGEGGPQGLLFNQTPQDEAPVEHGQMWADEGIVSMVQSAVDDAEEIPSEMRGQDSPAPQRDGDFVFFQDDAVIDEEMLRDMVAEIVRDELQGALGERITRNVRKLVRREIMRAISIRDFE